MPTYTGTANDLSGSDHTIALGVTEDFDPNANTTVITDHNFIVRGTLRMRPNPGFTHILRFVNVDESIFVGGIVGGMSRTPVATDVGLWVVDTGVLDAVGDPKVGWNRTGDDPTWDPTDTMLRVPWDKGDYTTFATHAKGDPLQTLVAPDGSIDVQECFNLTRSVQIEGTSGHRSHIFISSDSPQVIKYVRSRYMGPRKMSSAGNTEVVRGRWMFHLHHMSDAAGRASILEGCVAADGGSHAFVAHGSNGVTFRDCIAWNCNTDAFWWDTEAATDASADVLYDHCLVARIPIITGEFQQYTISGYRLQGTNGTVRDSVCVGNRGARTNPGFEWPEPGGSPPEVTHGLWANSGNVAHNNAGVGIYFWQNDHVAHQITDFRAFRNGGAGVIQGAYGTASHWDDVTVYDNNGGVAYGHFRFLAHSRTVLPSRVNEFHRMVAQSVVFGEHSLPPVGPAYIFDSQLTHAYVSEGTGNPDSGNGNPAWYWLIRCDLEPADWTVYFMHPTSVYWVQRSDNTAYQVNPNGTTTVIPQFYAATLETDANIDVNVAISATGRVHKLGIASVPVHVGLSGTGERIGGGGAALVHGAASIPVNVAVQALTQIHYDLPDDMTHRFILRKNYGGSVARGGDTLRSSPYQNVRAVTLRGDGAPTGARTGDVLRAGGLDVFAQEVQGAASIPVNVAISGSGGLGHVSGAATVPVSVAMSATGHEIVHGAANVPVSVAMHATAVKRFDAAATIPVQVAMSASASGSIVDGQASIPVTVTMAGTGRNHTFGAATVPVSVAMSGIPRNVVHGAASVPVSVAMSGAGHVLNLHSQPGNVAAVVKRLGQVAVGVSTGGS